MKVTKRRAILATAGGVAAGALVFGATTAFASSSPAPATTAPAPHGPWQKNGAHHGRPGFGGPGAFGGFGHAGGFGPGAHGEQTVKNSSGKWVDDVWQTGKVASISGDTVKVTDASGTSWTWIVGSTAKVRVGSKSAQVSSVKVGDTVSITGVQSGSTNNADTVLDGVGSAPHGPARPPRPNGAPGTPGSNGGSSSNSTAS